MTLWVITATVAFNGTTADNKERIMDRVYLTTANGGNYIFDMNDREITQISEVMGSESGINTVSNDWFKVIGAFMPVRGKELQLTVKVRGKRRTINIGIITEIVRK